MKKNSRHTKANTNNNEFVQVNKFWAFKSNDASIKTADQKPCLKDIK